MTKDQLAGAAVGSSWTLVGISLAEVNEVLTAISLICASAASIAAIIYYRRKK